LPNALCDFYSKKEDRNSILRLPLAVVWKSETVWSFILVVSTNEISQNLYSESKKNSVTLLKFNNDPGHRGHLNTVGGMSLQHWPPMSLRHHWASGFGDGRLRRLNPFSGVICKYGWPAGLMAGEVATGGESGAS